MKKLIAVTASIMLAVSAVSVNAQSLKLDKISNSDLIECVKENCSHQKESDCKIIDLLEKLFSEGSGLPNTDGNLLNSIISSLLDKLPSFKPETDKPQEDIETETPPEQEKPEENLPEELPPENDSTPEIPEQDAPETNIPQKPENDGNDSNSGFISESQYVNEVLKLVNQYRNQNGLPSVTLDASLCKAAEVRAKEIKTSFSHTRPNGSSCFTVLGELGISYGGAGENIAYGQSSPSEVMTAWMNSSGHRANILGSSFTKLGVGVYSSGGTLYWAQMFTY